MLAKALVLEGDHRLLQMRRNAVERHVFTGHAMGEVQRVADRILEVQLGRHGGLSCGKIGLRGDPCARTAYHQGQSASAMSATPSRPPRQRLDLVAPTTGGT